MTESRDTTKQVRLTESTHSRLKAHLRDGETLSGGIDRALDALEREAELPAVVTEALRDKEAEA